ncbi:hydroxylase [Verrucomicrobia bacterium S94]|nr:hydroxylase [Verrucomicrobia bacterium S94]
MRKQYGAIPFLYDKGRLKVVMITSARGYWIFPKGRFEEKLGKYGTAALEALEEAGVEGCVEKKHAFRAKVLINSGELVRLTLFALKVDVMHDNWDEDYRRKRRVVSVEEAKALITSDGLRDCLEQFEMEFGG